ncbi:MAG: tRNA1(Val) (adenine(37)-N6)-methyltransferase [Fusobacteriaceae bacterium]
MKDITELFGEYKIYQSKKGFRFSVDSVVLSDFYNEKKSSKVLDIGTGNGIIPILLAIKEKAENITGIELQKEVAELAEENINLNSLKDKIKIVNCNIKDFTDRNIYDVVVSNPPYMVVDGKNINDDKSKSIARHEIELTLKELIESAKKILKPRGSFYMVHRSHRVPEIICELANYGFSLERMKFVYHSMGEVSNLVLIKAVKGRKVICSVEAPLYLKE